MKKTINLKKTPTSIKKTRVDMTASKDGKSIRPRKIEKQGITKEQFLANLEKVCQPIKSDSEKSET